MSTIVLKQSKKGTYVDISSEDLSAPKFISNFKDFTKDAAGFLSGSSVALILPEDNSSVNINNILNEVQDILNEQNISLKASMANSHLESQAPEQDLESSGQAGYDLPETLYVKANLRAGQLVQYPGNVFIFGDVNPSAEIHATGDIVIWGKLRGIVHAGVDGNTSATVAALKFDTGQLRIADKMINPIDSIEAMENKNKHKDKGFFPVLAKIENSEIIITKG